MPSPELEEQISTNRNPDERSASDFGVIHQASQIGAVLFHGGRTFTHAGISVTAQIR
jgi:hypothetical protein